MYYPWYCFSPSLSSSFTKKPSLGYTGIMTRGILIAGNESTLFSAAASEAAKRVKSFASAVIPNRFPLPGNGLAAPVKAEAPGGSISLSWNPSSPISAHTLILAAENRLEKISDAILVCSPPAVFKTAETLSPDDIEIIVNDHIKGWFYLIRELILYFRRIGSGTLSFVIPELTPPGSARDTFGARKDTVNKNVQTDLLGPSASSSFRSFAQGILASSVNEPFQVMGFTGFEAGAEGEIASWFFKMIDEGSGKYSGRWQRYSKLSFFK